MDGLHEVTAFVERCNGFVDYSRLEDAFVDMYAGASNNEELDPDFDEDDDLGVCYDD